MPVDYTLDDLAPDHEAVGNLAGVADVSPDHAVGALEHGPVVGIPPSVAMRTPDWVQQSAASTRQQQALANPAIRQWAASADPAHLAATKDDLGPLAKVADSIGNIFGNPLRDIGEAFDAAIASGRQADALWSKGRFGKSIEAGVMSTIGIAGSPLAGITGPLGRGIATTPLANSQVRLNPNAGFFDSAASLVPTTSEAERQERGRALAEFALQLGLGTGNRNLARNAVAGMPRTPPAGAPEGPIPRLPAPGSNPPVDAIRTTVAQADAQAVAAVQEQLAATATHARSPAVAEAFVAQAVPGQTVSINPETLLKLAEAGHDPFPELASDIIQKAIDGELVQVPLSTYLARTAGQPFAADLNAATAFREGGLSLEESAELPTPTAPEGEAASAGVASPEPLAPDFTAAEDAAAKWMAESSRMEVEQVVKDLRLRELFTEPKAVGTTTRNFEAYSAGIEEHIAKVTEKLTAKAVAAIKAERKPEWQATVAQRRAEVEKEWAQEPVLRAWVGLAHGKGVLGEPLETPLKLDREEAIAQYGQDLGLPPNMFRKGGLSADDAAELFGFPTGADMLRALAELQATMGDRTFAQHLKATLDETAAAITREELGFDISPEGLHLAASEAISAPTMTNYLARDLKEFAAEHGLPFDPAATAQLAIERFNGRPTKEAINIRAFEAMVNRDSRKLETALLAGDIPTAFKAKQNQYQHLLELQQAHRFLKLWNRAGRSISKWAKKRDLKSIAPEYMARLHQVLRDQQVPLRRDLDELQRTLGDQPLEAWAEAKRSEGQDIQTFAIPADPIDKLTVTDFRNLWKSLLSIATNGKREANTQINDWVAQVEAETADVPDIPIERHVGDWHPKFGGISSKLRSLDASHTGIEDIADRLGGPNSVFNRVLIHGAEDAANTFDRLQAEIYTPITEKFLTIPAATRAKYKTRIPNTALLDPRDQTPLPLRRADILPLLANLGTEANALKLAEGYGTTVEAITQLVSEHITPEEAEFVQFAWDQLTDKLFPLADANARANRGYGLTKVPAKPVTVAGIRLRGGYWPLNYDWRLSTAVDSELKPFTSVKPFRPLTTPSGFEQERTGFIAPIYLSLDSVLREHLRDVVTRIAYQDYIQTAQRFIKDKRIRTIVDRKIGPVYYAEFMPWLERQVMDAGLQDANQRLAAKLRQNMTVATMGAKFSVGWNQLQGFVPVVSEIGERWTIDGYYNFYKDVLTGQLNRNLYSKSETMKFRHLNMEQNVREVRSNLSRMDPTNSTVGQWRRKLAEGAMAFINLADKYMVSGAAWTGAFRKAKFELMMTEGDAIRYADKVVRKTQGEGRPMSLPRIQRANNEFQKFMVFAYTPVNRMYNLQRAAIREIGRGNFRSGSRRFFWLFMAAPLIGMWFAGELPDEEERKHPERYMTKAFGRFALNAWGNSIWTRDVLSGLYNLSKGQDPFEVSNPYIRAVTSIQGLFKYSKNKGLQVKGPGSDKRWVKAWANLLGMAGILPGAGQIGNTLQFLEDVRAHRAKPKNPAEWFTGLTSGRIEK